jgi:hypothetical protein
MFFLIHSIHDLLEYLFIVFEEEGYRLVVNRVGKIIKNKNYKTVEEAKEAFFNDYSLLAVMDGVIPQWTNAYPPDIEWLDQRLKGAPIG